MLSAMKASIASITLSDRCGELTVRVSDNGIGFQRVGRSLGLLEMEERAAAVGAGNSNNRPRG
jgi:signal transduction histidine kinase